MKKIFSLMCVAAIAAGMSFSVKAQDFSSLEGSNYYLIWLDGDTEAEFEITDKIVQDLRPNWAYETNPTGERALYIWTNTYAANEPTGVGSFGQIGGFFDFTVIADWSGLGFCMRHNGDDPAGESKVGDAPDSFPVDFTGISDDYRFHMAAKSTIPNAQGIEIFGGGPGSAGYFSIGIGSFDGKPNITPGFKTDGSWNIIDIPVSQLRGYGFTNRSPFKGNYFCIHSGGAPSNIGFDAVFFYNPSPSGINNPNAENKLRVLVTNQIIEVLNATAPVEVYDIAGIKVKTSEEPVFGVEELKKGAYIIKSGKAVAKVIIK
jgi:hypothetical protein